MDATTFGLGCEPSPPDHRDFAPQGTPPGVLAALPAQYLITPWAPIQNQGNEGTCAGHAGKGIADHRELLAKFGRERAARDIYEGARIFSPVTGEGAHLRAVCKSLQKSGACEERFWPYVAGGKGEPLPGAAESRLTCRASEYYRIPPAVDEIKAALVKYGPLLARIEVCDGFRHPRAGLPIIRRGEQGGGHAVILTGYDNAKKTWRIRNSWGRSWADGGYCDLSWEYGITECWALKFAILAVPPAPEPAPLPPAPPAPQPAPPAPAPPAPPDWWGQVLRWLGGL